MVCLVSEGLGCCVVAGKASGVKVSPTVSVVLVTRLVVDEVVVVDDEVVLLEVADEVVEDRVDLVVGFVGGGKGLSIT